MKSFIQSPYTFFAGLLIMVLGISVLFGWHIDSSALVQISPSFAPMQYNTALGFVLSAFGSILIALNQDRIAQIVGVLVLAIGGATLAQYLLQTDFGIDQLLMDHKITTKTSHPGRMAPNTALCFSMFGLLLITFGRGRTIRFSLALSLLVLSGIALLGYMMNQETVYGWGNLTRMAIHTCIGFIVLALSIIAYDATRDTDKTFDVWRLLPFGITSALLVITFFSWYSVREISEFRNRDHFETLVNNTQTKLLDRYQHYEHSLWGGLGLFYASDNVTRSEWHAYISAINITKNLPGINGVGYIDYVRSADLETYLQTAQADEMPDFRNHPNTPYSDKFIIKFIEPIDQNLSAVGLDIGFEQNRRTAAERARDTGLPSLTKKIELVQDEKKQAGFLLLLPHYKNGATSHLSSKDSQNFKGWVYAPFIGANFLSGLKEGADNQLDFNVYDGTHKHKNTLIYTTQKTAEDHKASIQSGTSNHHKDTMTEIAGRQWTIVWQSSDQYNAPTNENMASYIALLGFIFSAFVFILLHRLMHSKDVISKTVKHRTAQLQKAKEKAQQASKMKSEFLANMSHEIRTPLNGVIGAADLIGKTKITKQQDKYLDVIIRSGETLLGLINDILDLSKIEANEIQLNPEAVELDNFVSHILHNFKLTAKDKGVKLLKVYEGKIPVVIMADPLRLTQILTNLLSNALKFVETGHVTLSVKEIQTFEKATTLTFSIEDTGIGIPEDKLDTIFNKFEQADITTTKIYGGTGLGLPITESLVGLMGGDIHVKSKLGQGTTFWFDITVPVIMHDNIAEEAVIDKQTSKSKKLKKPKPNKKTQPKTKKKQKRVLLIENEMVNQMVATDMLENLGYKVDLAENGKIGVEKVQEKIDTPYDVILMDCMMPVMDGFDATAAIRQWESSISTNPNIIIAMTANAMSDEKEKCIDAGMDDYLAKPVKEVVLKDKIEEYI